MEATVTEEFGFKNAADLRGVWAHWFLYGATGSGKTQAASTFPRPLFIVPMNEKSIVTLRGLDVPYYEVCDMDRTALDPKTGVGSMKSIIDRIEMLYRKDPDGFPFDTIVVESLTHYGDLIQEQLTNGSTTAMRQQDWGVLGSHVRSLQSRLRALDLHVVYTALDKTESSEDGKTLIGSPQLIGQLTTKLPSACDVIAYCETFGNAESPVFRVHFRKHKHFPARSRFKRLPAYMDNFNFSEISACLDADDLVEEQPTTNQKKKKKE